MEILKTQLRKQEEDNKLRIAEQASVRTVMKRYSRVVLVSASDIQDRLWHLCVRQAQSTNKVLLAEDEHAPMYGAWPMTKNHYLTGTMYMFSRYFCWVEIIKSSVSFLEFSNDKETIEFSRHLKRIERMLAETSLQKLSIHRISTDSPVFQLMQTEIGEALREPGVHGDQCMSYRDYRSNYARVREDSEATAQLEKLLIGAMSDAKGSFCLTRLKLTGNALASLVHFLRRANALGDDASIETIPISDFDNGKFQTTWPIEVSRCSASATFT
jgi:hypothetical protein